jgi:hypothetical protein
MSDLTPEVRVDKNGHAVTKHVRNEKKQHKGFISRIIPSLNGSAGKQKESDLALLTEEIRKEIDFRDESALVKILGGYSSRTITAIRDAYSGSGELVAFIEQTYPENERDIRTAAHFKEVRFDREHFSSILDSVRDAMGVNDLENIPAGTDEYTTAKAILEVAVRAASIRSLVHENRMIALQAQGHSRSEAFDATMKDSKKDRSGTYMSHALARIISEKPERASDIADYLLDKKATPKTVDMELLRMYLNSDAPPLADGLL